MTRRDLVLLAAFPAQPENLVKEMVTASHGNLPRVRELLKLRPALVNASWDWGYGDWETALGAASHVGNREIANLLLDAGAAPTLFSAAMLGHLDTVKSICAAQPNAFRLLGPHGIPLLTHAKAGGAPAVVAYLESLGDTGKPAAQPVPPEEQERLRGRYGDYQVSIVRNQLQLVYKQETPRPIHAIAPRTFHPAGAPAVRIVFSEDYRSVTITDGESTASAARHTP